MPPITQIAAAVAPLSAAAVLLAAKTLGAGLGLDELPSVDRILKVTGVGRSRAYELASQVPEAISSLLRPVGRPSSASAPSASPSPPRDAASSNQSGVAGVVLRYIMGHPGCVHAHGKRQRYSDDFRLFIVELRAQHAEVSVEDFAEAVVVPCGTLKSWITDLPALIPSDDASPPPSTGSVAMASVHLTVTTAHVATVLESWKHWHGGFVDFCKHVRDELRIPWGRDTVKSILEVHGVRLPKRRVGRSPDELALRGAFDTFFPGAQWVGDGKSVNVTVGLKVFNFNLELMVDAKSGAFVGLSVSEQEDSQAVVDAFTGGVATTGKRPIAALLDNKPSNHTPQVDTAIGETMRIRATPERPQNKAHVEGAFGLFSQTVPQLKLEWPSSPRVLAESILRMMTITWARATNHRPRDDRGGRSRVDLYGDKPTREEMALATQALAERLDKQEKARATREARQRPEVRDLLDEAFERLTLLDPERHIRLAIARYPLDAIVDAIAVFEAKRDRGSLPDGADARYLLGIVRNVDAEREQQLLANTLLFWRTRARDHALVTLEKQLQQLTTTGRPARDVIADCSTHALLDDRRIDRDFWRDALVGFIVEQPESERLPLYQSACRRIRTTYRAAPRERQGLICALARAVKPTI